MIDVNLGRRELGKTTLAKYLAEQRSPRIIIDPRAHWTRTADADFYQTYSFTSMLQSLEHGRDVVLQPRDLIEDVERTASVAQQWIEDDTDGTTELAIVFDECGLYKDAIRSWSWVMRCSPRDRTLIVLTAHRPADISTDIRALVDLWCLFRTTQIHDLDAIEDRCGPDVRRAVQELPPYHFISWDDAKAQMNFHTDPTLWKIPVRGGSLVGTPAKLRRQLWES